MSHPIPAATTLTRRRLLGTGLAAGGAILLGRATPVLAAGPEPVFSAELAPSGTRRTGGWIVGSPVSPRRRFDLVGVEWLGLAPTGSQLRVRRRGRWSPWVDARLDHGHGPDGAPSARQVSDPVWTGGAELVQVRARGPWSRGKFHFVAVAGGGSYGGGAPITALPAARSAQAPTPSTPGSGSGRLAQPVLNAGPGQPPIIARRVWARGFRPDAKPEYAQIKLAFVHHTESANAYGPGESAAMVLSIAHYHRDVRGWHDIGYNFLIDRFGRIFEGRAGGIDEAVVGAQAGGYNLVSTGVGLLGSFQDALPPRPTLLALAHLLGWKLALHGLPVVGTVTVHVDPAGASYSRYPAGAAVPLKRISGHRDADSTDCPGNALYRHLPALRQEVVGLTGQHAVLTLTGAPSSGAAGMAALSGRLTLADGTAIPQAAIAIQKRTIGRRRAGGGGAGGESTIGTATTAADGTWSATVPLTAHARLRALYAGDASHPAAISDALEGLLAAATQPSAPQPPAAQPPATQPSTPAPG